MARFSFGLSVRRAFSISSMSANFFECPDNIVGTHSFPVIVAIRVEKHFFARILQIEGDDDQAIAMHFHEEIVSRKMIPPLLR
jgi:hypothetical protein